ncbi:MAG TPA: bifunctional diaminohydroxyphosphoribosylaminopyrimidine deaminase/5-amino-6-(5-phosphoribosylamino)uracil reductase RibD [Thermoanaerobaculia bacterium]|nr:bifunctional diaminohydroxyphosphoribosylaminopyrimidine deaminase/5-amino-6-(5-phosphoribosylamino)uracil reductase RibD [Thermoanaerobaculia bacterium]
MRRADDAGDEARDLRWLRRTLVLARRGAATVAPNPRVGAVVVRDGAVLAEGWHRRVGEPHAEIEALSRLADGAARDATLYVNLEPCSHQGRTPPCVPRVIGSGVRRVVCCHRDPDPRVAGSGLDQLRAAGISVRSGLLVEESVRENLPFLVPRLLGRPTVTLKWAASLDGKIATRTGASQWISSPAGRRWALGLREEHDAILVGRGTVLADDPRLDRRLGRAPGAIVRVVLDRSLRVPPGARLFQVAGRVLLYTESRDEVARAHLERAGAEIVWLESLDPAAVVADLGRRGLDSVLVEGGGEILGAFAASGVFDRIAVCCAPLLIGGEGAPGPLSGRGVARLEEAARIEGLRTRRRGADLIIEGVRSGCSRDLSQRLAG